MEDPVVDRSLRLLRLDKRHKMATMTMRMSTNPATAIPMAKSL